MELFFKDLEEKIEQAVKKDFEKIFLQIGDERIYSVALVTDSDCVTLFLALNTYEYMEKRDAEYKNNEQYMKVLKSSLSKEKIKNIMEGTISFTKWIPAEWGYSSGKDSELVEVSKELFAKEETLNQEEHLHYRELFFETIISALKSLIELKIFQNNSEKITYFVSVSDDENIIEIENYSAKLLNEPNLYKQFLKRTEFWKK